MHRVCHRRVAVVLMSFGLLLCRVVVCPVCAVARAACASCAAHCFSMVVCRQVLPPVPVVCVRTGTRHGASSWCGAIVLFDFLSRVRFVTFSARLLPCEPDARQNANATAAAVHQTRRSAVQVSEWRRRTRTDGKPSRAAAEPAHRAGSRAGRRPGRRVRLLY
jgi:hypothetical protein